MKSLILLILTAVMAAADTYTLYLVRGDEQHLAGATADDILARVNGSDAIIEVFLQTDSKAATKGGGAQVYNVEYIEEWDAQGIPLSKKSREVGARFEATENGDLVSFDITATKLEGWIFVDEARTRLQPIFASTQLNTEMNIPKDSKILLGGLTREENKNGVTRKVVACFLIKRSGS